MKRILAVPAAAISLWLPILNGSVAANDRAFDPGSTVKAVAEILEREHLARKPLNDELSQSWLRTFLAALDPRRMYFLAVDYQEFQRFENRLDDMAKASDFQFAKLVRERYRQRVMEAATYAEEVLLITHDYSELEEYPRSFDGCATKREELRERWRLRLKTELLIEKLHGRQLTEVQSQLSSRYQRISRQARDMTDERLCQVYLDSLSANYDQHSSYLTPSFVSSLETGFIQKYSLGFFWRQQQGDVVITSIIPALQDASMRDSLVGWHLIAIRRLDGTIIDLVEMNYKDVFDIISEPFAPLEMDTEVILELMNPVNLKRVTMSWNRFSLY